MARFANFNINEVSVIVCSVPLTDGKAPDAYIEFEFPDDWEEDESADGLVCRSATGRSLVKAKLKLLGASTDNDKLSAVQVLDLNSPGAAGVGRFFYKDNNGSSLISSDRCWITKRPNFGVGAKRGQITWDFRFLSTANSVFVGGNLT